MAGKQSMSEVVHQGPEAQAGQAAMVEGKSASQARPVSGAEREQAGVPKSVWREYFESIIHVAIMYLFFTTFIALSVGVPTSSMENTILVGDKFLINRFIFAPGSEPFFLPKRAIRRGDIIVFKYPGDRDHPLRDRMNGITPYKDYFIKRVIGLPGDRIEVRGASVLVNGQALPEHRVSAEQGKDEKSPLDINSIPPRKSNEPYTVYYSSNTLAARADQPDQPSELMRYGVGQPFQIPEGYYFMMGDNRDNSADSRVWGLVSRDLVIGRALFIFWSYNASAASNGNFLVDFYQNSRWDRIGMMIK
ncbi:MAG TPA: signal peptidase I [Pyrinomonadaceae bacterium]